MQIMSVDASFGGANHDAFIWANHPIKAHLEQLSNTENSWLLGMHYDNFYLTAFVVSFFHLMFIIIINQPINMNTSREPIYMNTSREMQIGDGFYKIKNLKIEEPFLNLIAVISTIK